jgi:N-acetylglutamate synthase-like GNAT family acetyltransferase
MANSGPRVTIRSASLEDIPVLQALIRRSARGLQAPYYSVDQIEGALGTVFGVDTRLIEDGTYFVAQAASLVVGCGGWSRRKTLFGGDRIADRDDSPLDPSADAARIRAIFVDPEWARRGIGSKIMRSCEAAATSSGFLRLELMATLAGEPLFAARGFVAVEHTEVPLPNGAVLPIVRMLKVL